MFVHSNAPVGSADKGAGFVSQGRGPQVSQLGNTILAEENVGPCRCGVLRVS